MDYSEKSYFNSILILNFRLECRVSRDATFNSTSFNKGKGKYHTRCYYTDITNASREAGIVKQQLLERFLAAWMDANEPLSNWTFNVLEDEGETESESDDGNITESDDTGDTTESDDIDVDDDNDDDGEEVTKENVENDKEMKTQNAKVETETVDKNKKVQQPASQLFFQPASASSNAHNVPNASNNVSYSWLAPVGDPQFPAKPVIGLDPVGYPKFPTQKVICLDSVGYSPIPSLKSYLHRSSWVPKVPSQTSF